jgi:hypothetical protein
VLDSILAHGVGYVRDLIVVVDGPNIKIEQEVDDRKSDFSNNKIDLKKIVNKKNMGRFEARFIGVRDAKCNEVIFIDDRCMVTERYFDDVSKLSGKNVISNIIEDDKTTIINALLRMVRRKYYRGKWGKEFKSYRVTESNFDITAKGTSGLCVDRHQFIDICEKLSDGVSDTKNISDDTAILSRLLSGDKQLWKSGEANLIYVPRVGFKSEIKHIYERGPKFVNYYIGKSTARSMVVASLLLFVAGLITVLVAPLLLLVFVAFMLIALSVASAYVANNTREFITAFFVAPVIFSTFCLGVMKGLIMEIRS